MTDFLIVNYLVNSLNLSSNKIRLLLNHPTESRFKDLFKFKPQNNFIDLCPHKTMEFKKRMGGTIPFSTKFI